MSIINNPPIQRDLSIVDHPNGRVASWGHVWSAWFTQAFQVLFAAQQSGTTAQRPTTNLWPGRPYFDTSLGTNGKPIFVNKAATGWVLADGTTA